MTNDTALPIEPALEAEPEDPPRRNGTFLKRISKILFSDSDSDDLRGQLEQAVGPTSSPNDDSFSEQERVMIANILRFGSLRVEDVMVPRADIKAIDETATLKELLHHFENVGHSRLPVYRDTLDDPTGMVHVKDLLSWIVEQGESKLALPQEKLNLENVGLKVIAGGRSSTDNETIDSQLAANPAIENKPVESSEHLKSPAGEEHSELFRLTDNDIELSIKDVSILREVLYVPPSMPVVNLLLRMQSTRVHLALVVDEYGGTDGLVSIEDLVEEVVGDIEDEHDENNNHLMTGSIETGLTASARTPVEDLEERFNITLHDEDDERYYDIDTLGGLVFSMVGRVPVRGEIITHDSGLEIEVLTADPRRIKTLKIRKKAPPKS